jgi:hypothetical protein
MESRYRQKNEQQFFSHKFLFKIMIKNLEMPER